MSSWKLATRAAAVVLLGAAALLPAFPGTPEDASAARPGKDAIRVHLLFTNDVHGHIAPEGARFMNPNFPPPLGGAASAAAYIKRVRDAAARAGEAVLLVDVGDMFQGTPVGTKTRGEAVIEYFNAVGYDLTVPGNHDFDLGRENTERLARLSKFPWLCANIVWKETGEIPDWLQPTLILERAGLRLGFIGVITEATAGMSFPANIEGLDFLPMPEVVARHRDELRAAGAQAIFLISHAGLPYDAKAGWRDIVESQGDERRRAGGVGSYDRGMGLMELINVVPGIDVAVGGHTHRGYEQPWIDPMNHTLAFETYGNGSSLGHAILEFDRATGILIGWKAPHDRGSIITLFEDELWPDAETAALLRPWIEKTEVELDRVVGQAAANLPRGDAGSNLVGFAVTDAMRTELAADFAIQNLGGLRADISAGPIRARTIFDVLPFGNELVVARVPGSLLLQMVETKLRGDGSGIVISGGKVAYDLGRPDGQRVVAFEVGGRPLELGREYSLVATNYLMEGNSGLEILTTIPPEKVEARRITTAEAFERYVAAHSPLRVHGDDRWLERRGAARAAYLDTGS